MIDWEGTIRAYNRDNKTNFTTRKEFLSILYEKHPSTFKIEKIIYVSHTAIWQAMKKDGIELLPKGHRLYSLLVKKIFDLNTEGMTVKEISKATGLMTRYCYIILNRFELPWKRRFKIVKCGWCNGRGFLIHKRKWMQNGFTKIHTYIVKCSVCKGNDKEEVLK